MMTNCPLLLLLLSSPKPDGNCDPPAATDVLIIIAVIIDVDHGMFSKALVLPATAMTAAHKRRARSHSLPALRVVNS